MSKSTNLVSLTKQSSELCMVGQILPKTDGQRRRATETVCAHRSLLKKFLREKKRGKQTEV